MKFSIVTPSFNQGRFIRDCLESVKAQSGVAWEHIVQEAGSTDETLAILKEFPHVHLATEKDAGMSDGINRGFRKATGDWVMWLNTDDYLLPNALAKVAAFSTRHPEADVIYGDCLFVDEQKLTLRRKREHPFDFSILLFYGCYIPSTSTFINRRIINAGHLLEVAYKVCMDFEYYVRLSRLGYRFAYLPEALAAFRWHETNTSRVQLQRRREERLRVQQEHLVLAGRQPPLSRNRLALLYRVYQVKRGLLRLRAHGLKA